MSEHRLYLDYNATSPLAQSVKDWLSGDFNFANPSSQHSRGKSSRKLINQARATVFETFNKDENNTKLFFHSGATEAIRSFAYSFSEWTRTTQKKLLICFSRVDHPAVTSLQEIHHGNHVSIFEIKRNKKLEYSFHENYSLLKDKKEQDPSLVILYHHLWVHNETGHVSALEELKLLKTIPDLYVHVDAVQSPGKISCWNNLSEGDIWTFSSHKFGALKGVGFSLLKDSFPFYPLIGGGGQQSGMRSGTENIHGIMSTSIALNELKKINVNKTLELKNNFLIFLKNQLSGVGKCLEYEQSASNTIYFFLYHYTSDIALALFDIHGIEISAGSACSSGASKESSVLLEMGIKDVARNGLRISLPIDLSDKDLDIIKERFERVLSKLKNMP